MDLINSSPIITKLLSVIAPVARLMPKSIIKLRLYKKSGIVSDFSKPDDLQQIVFSQYFEALKNPEQRRLLADLTDKIAVRDYVEQRLGSEVLTKLCATCDRPEDIDWDKLPVPCVIKTNNGCGTNLFVRTRDDIDAPRFTARLKRWLTYPYGALSGQPHYSYIKPRVLVEELLIPEPGSAALPRDYKVFCFGGKARFILTYDGRKPNSHHSTNTVYDTEWNVIENAANFPTPELEPRPEALETLIAMAEKLAQGIDFVRVDFYIINGKPVFGEMTFTPDVYTNFTIDFLRKAVKWHPKAQAKR